MNKQYPLKLARICALLVALSGVSIAGVYVYVASGDLSSGLTLDSVIVATVGLLIVLVGVLLIFTLPKYHKVLIVIMLLLSVASVPLLCLYILLLRMALTAGPVGFQWFLPIALPIIHAVLLVWLIVVSVRFRKPYL